MSKKIDLDGNSQDPANSPVPPVDVNQTFRALLEDHFLSELKSLQNIC